MPLTGWSEEFEWDMREQERLFVFNLVSLHTTRSRQLRMDSRRSESRQSSRTSRPSSSLGANRPASSLSYSTSSFLNQPKTPKPSAARYGGLAEKDLQKVHHAPDARLHAWGEDELIECFSNVDRFNRVSGQQQRRREGAMRIGRNLYMKLTR